ncbi:butyryl-CoA:acetate CoA-transferase [Peptoniphilus sp. GNH]|nr:butyryl-CoA:acetate CoA-transferase [Clostridiales bacterium KA00134]UHR03395.1 butyryl-CoA:acetate CoA-transferase [Peptoniphilus sp. GNH]
MDYSREYEQKLITAKKAASLVKDGYKIDLGFGVNFSVAVEAELAKRVDELKDVIVYGSIAVRKPKIFDADPEGQVFTWNSWHTLGYERAKVGHGLFYAPIRYSELPRYYRENVKHIDMAIIPVTRMDKHGYFNFGMTASHLRAIFDVADVIVLEVNKNIPRALGGFETDIHISEVDYLVEADFEIPTVGKGSFTETDLKIAKYVVDEISDGSCLQLGIGATPNAIGAVIADSDLKDLGVHTEMYVDAFVDMAKRGKVTGLRKNIDKGRQAFAFALGSQEMYDYIDDNPEMMAVPVSYINGSKQVAALDKFMSINSAVNVNLWGEISSESSGTRHISGAGGQLDFVIGAYESNGGKTFICITSKYFDKKAGKEISRIVPVFDQGTIVTCTRPNTQYIVTEYGIFNTKGKSAWERAEGIINLAAPEFRDELIKEAQKMNMWRNSNKR